MGAPRLDRLSAETASLKARLAEAEAEKAEAVAAAREACARIVASCIVEPEIVHAARDVLGEALWRTNGGPQPWLELPSVVRKRWRQRADAFIARLTEAGYRIVKEGN